MAVDNHDIIIIIDLRTKGVQFIAPVAFRLVIRRETKPAHIATGAPFAIFVDIRIGADRVQVGIRLAVPGDRFLGPQRPAVTQVTRKKSRSWTEAHDRLKYFLRYQQRKNGSAFG